MVEALQEHYVPVARRGNMGGVLLMVLARRDVAPFVRNVFTSGENTGIAGELVAGGWWLGWWLVAGGWWLGWWLVAALVGGAEGELLGLEPSWACRWSSNEPATSGPSAEPPPRAPAAGVGWNKGGMAVSLQLGYTDVCLINCHLAAHQGKLKERNQNYAEIAGGPAAGLLGGCS